MRKTNIEQILKQHSFCGLQSRVDNMCLGSSANTSAPCCCHSCSGTLGIIYWPISTGPIPSVLRGTSALTRLNSNPQHVDMLGHQGAAPLSAQIIALGDCDVEKQRDKLFLDQPKEVRGIIQTTRDLSHRGPACRRKMDFSIFCSTVTCHLYS